MLPGMTGGTGGSRDFRNTFQQLPARDSGEGQVEGVGQPLAVMAIQKQAGNGGGKAGVQVADALGLRFQPRARQPRRPARRCAARSPAGTQAAFRPTP
jgi:hypothetical protein